jgi:predicted acylesterase/phospholipase RssA
MSAYQQGRSKTETVLILQGGGSLGAYERGVISTLYKHDIKFNIIAGSSIGAINASIIASAQNRGKDPANILKDFWQTLQIMEHLFSNPLLFSYFISSSRQDDGYFIINIFCCVWQS